MIKALTIEDKLNLVIEQLDDERESRRVLIRRNKRLAKKIKRLEGLLDQIGYRDEDMHNGKV